MFHFLSGATAAASLGVTLFFVRFWLDTRDRLFLLFAVAFGAMTLSRAILAFTAPDAELHPYLYVVRLVAFVIIAYAVIDKNRAR